MSNIGQSKMLRVLQEQLDLATAAHALHTFDGYRKALRHLETYSACRRAERPEPPNGDQRYRELKDRIRHDETDLAIKTTVAEKAAPKVKPPRSTRRMVSAREIVGRRIAEFHPNPFDDGRGGTTYNPVFVLDDGSRLTFMVEETDGSEYGIFMSRNNIPKRGKEK